MGNKIDFYVKKLRSLKDPDTFLLAESGLPGPRGNLELAQAFAKIGDENLIQKYISIKPTDALGNSAEVFLMFCGVVGLGTLIAEGKVQYSGQLHEFASDPRWRIREAVAMALQRVGDSDFNLLLREAKELSKGNFLEKRAAAAALCEPRLLTSEKVAGSVLEILDDITSSIVGFKEKGNEEFEVLKKGLAYCWSVAVVAYPDKGKKLMEKWTQSNDKNVVWIMKQNLQKKRLTRMDREWVQNQMEQLQ